MPNRGQGDTPPPKKKKKNPLNVGQHLGRFGPNLVKKNPATCRKWKPWNSHPSNADDIGLLCKKKEGNFQHYGHYIFRDFCWPLWGLISKIQHDHSEPMHDNPKGVTLKC